MSDTVSELNAAGTIFGDESDSLKKVGNKIKFSIFNFMNTIINEEIIRFPFRYLFYIIETIQIIAFAFEPPMLKYWKNTAIVDILGKIIVYFNLAPALRSANFSVATVIFYLAVGFMGIIFLLTTYIHVSITRRTKKNSKENHWSIAVFRIFLEGQQILSLPFIMIFLIPLKCVKYVGNDLVLSDYNEVVCFQGNHIVHFFVAILALTIYCSFVILIIMLGFEYRRRPTHKLCKYSSNADTLFVIQKLLLALIFELLIMSKFEIFLIVVFTFSSFGLYYLFNSNIYYYSKKISYLCSYQHLICFWTGFVLLLSYVLQNSQFQGQVFLWVAGLILITIIVVITEDFKLDLLYINTNKFENENMAVVFLHYLNVLLHEVHSNKKVEFLLDCLTEYHKTYCIKPTCPSRQTYVKTKNLKMIFKEDYEDENYIMLVYLCHSMYNFALDKFNFSPKLRIQLAGYMYDNLRIKQQSLQELMIADSCKPSFLDEYVIYSLKKSIEEEMMQSNQMGGGNHSSDLLDELTFHNLDKRIKVNIERSTSLHLELWSLLSEDIPDLTRLTDCGTRIIYINNQIENDWLKVKNLNVSTLNRAYAKYLYFILQDTDEAFNILEKLRKINNMSNKGQILESQLGDITNDSTLRIFLSCQETNFGQITNLNAAAASALGYTKNELINVRVNTIMPQIFSKNHDRFLESYISNYEEKALMSERMIVAKTKTNYVVPFFINVFHVPSIVNNLQFMATFKLEKIYKVVAYIVIDHQDGIVLNISSGCLNVLGIDEKKLIKGDLKIADIVPSFYESIKDQNSRLGIPVDVNIFSPDGTYETTAMKVYCYEIVFREFGLQGYIVKFERLSPTTIATTLSPDGQAIDLNSKINLETPSNLQVPGSSLKSSRRNRYEVENENLKNFFMMKYDIGTNRYVGDMMNIENQPDFLKSVERLNKMNENIMVTHYDYEDSSRLVAPITQEQRDMEETYLKYIKASQDSRILSRMEENIRKNMGVSSVNANLEDINMEKIDFGSQIRTLKLFANRLYDPEDLKKEFLRESDDENSENENGENPAKENEKMQQNMNQDDDEFDEDNDDNSSLFKTREKFKTLIAKENNKGFFPITRLNLAGFFAIILILSLGIIYYAVNRDKQQNLNKNYDILKNANDMIQAAEGVLNRVHQLTLLQKGVYVGNVKITESGIKQEIKNYANKLGEYQTFVQLNTFYLSSDHKKFFQSNSVPIYFYDNVTDTFSRSLFDINAATQQIISKSLAVSETDITLLTNKNSDILFLKYNLLNDYFVNLKLSASLFSRETQDLINEAKDFLLIILIVSVFTSIIGIVVLGFFYFLILGFINKILQVFLEIPINKAKTLFAKCEMYLTNLQQGGDDDELLDSENMQNLEEEEELEASYTNQSAASKKIKARRKRYKANIRPLKIFILELIFISLCFEAFFTMFYVSFTKILDDQLQFKNELNNTLIMNPMFSFANNAIRQYISDKSFKILNNTSPTASISSTIDDIYSIFSLVKKDHSENLKIQSDFYNEWYTQTMLENVCLIYKGMDSTKYSDCETIGHASLVQGLALMISHFLEETRRMYAGGNYAWNTQNANFSELKVYEIETDEVKTIVNDTQYNVLLNIYRSDMAIDLNEIILNYFYPMFDLMGSKFLKGINDEFETENSLFLIILIIFIITLIFTYMAFWISVVNSLYLRVTRVRNFLLLIPIEIIQSSKSIMEKLIQILK